MSGSSLPATYHKLTATTHSKNFREAVELLTETLPESPAPDDLCLAGC